MKIAALLTTSLILCSAAHADPRHVRVPERAEYFDACLPQSREIAAQYLETTQDKVSHETGLAACQCAYEAFPKVDVMTTQTMRDQFTRSNVDCFLDIREDTQAFTRKYADRYRDQSDADK